MMDWQSEEGESNAGMVGNFVNFGAVGPEHVQDEVKNQDGEVVQHQDDVFIIIAPVRKVFGSTSVQCIRVLHLFVPKISHYIQLYIPSPAIYGWHR
jgi:hypothetical protein